MIAMVDFDNGACAGVIRFGQSCCPVRCLAGKSRGHMQIHAVKVQPPATSVACSNSFFPAAANIGRQGM